jgi:hypothetical protein
VGKYFLLTAGRFIGWLLVREERRMMRHARLPGVLIAGLAVICCLCVAQAAFAGSVVAWGQNNDGQTAAPDGDDFVAIAAGEGHSLALRSDGSIVGWGAGGGREATPPDGNDFVAIAAGGTAVMKHAYEGFSLALKSDGSLVQWGPAAYGPIPVGNDFVAIAAGGGTVWL